FADLMGNGPLMALFGWLGLHEDLPPTTRSLRPSTLPLPLIETYVNPKMHTSQRDRIDRRLSQRGSGEQFLDGPINRIQQFLATEVVEHDETRSSGVVYICTYPARAVKCFLCSVFCPLFSVLCRLPLSFLTASNPDLW